MVTVAPPWIIHHQDLARVGADLAQRLTPGIPLFLQGPVGAGKSTLARAILSVLMPHVASFPSPSFPLMIPYETPHGPVCHFDLYRITDPLQLASLNLEYYFHHTRCLVEWPEALANHRPPVFWTIHVRFSPHDPLQRHVWICSSPCSITHHDEANANKGLSCEDASNQQPA